ncbi:MAG: SpoIIE family protein phosphatase, partial [Acidimicrobiia bacterium]
VTGSASDAGGARRFVSGVLQRGGVASELADDAVLATSELATNALRHAGGLVALRVDVTGLRVHVEVEDGSAQELRRRDPGPFDTSGRGLVILDELASRWGTSPTDDGGKVVWFELDRLGPARADELDADLGERDRLSAPGVRVVVVAAAALAGGLLLGARTSGTTDPELALGLWTVALALVATLVAGFAGALAAAAGLGLGALLFHRDDASHHVSAALLSLGVALGAIGVGFFTWAGLELRARARSEARLLRRLAALTEALAGVESVEDPVADVAQAAAATTGARTVDILRTRPLTPESAWSRGIVVLPLEGPRRHKAMVLHLDRPAARIPSAERQAFYRSVADRCAAALERIELLEAERRARADLELLADASRALGGSLDPGKVATALSDALVPRLADHLEVLLEGGATPAGETAQPVPGGHVVRFGLRSRDRAMGTLVAQRRDRRFDDDDRALLREVAGRAAAALDNALLYEEQRATARTLERSLLPSALRVGEHLDIGARYLAAAGSNEVGGDFYDVLPNPAGDTVLVVGDVQGKGVEAATLTALARHTLRAAALAGLGPVPMLERLNLALRWQQAEREMDGDEDDDVRLRFVTAAVAVLHPTATGFRATVARGGHPFPIVVRPAGQVEHLRSEGTILGAFEDPGCTEVTVDLGLSDTLVLFTDGVVEHRAADDLFDELQLGRLLRNQLTATRADDLAGVILDTVVGVAPTESRDDVAVLVTRVTGPR